MKRMTGMLVVAALATAYVGCQQAASEPDAPAAAGDEATAATLVTLNVPNMT